MPDGINPRNGLTRVRRCENFNRSKWSFLRVMYRANVMLWSSYDGIPVTSTRDSFDVIMHTKLTADDDDVNDDSD